MASPEVIEIDDSSDDEEVVQPPQPAAAPASITRVISKADAFARHLQKTSSLKKGSSSYGRSL